MDAIWISLEQILQWQVLLVILVSAFYGLFMGAIPGLTATMAVALLVPLTFFLDDIPALAAIVTLEACAIFAGDIPTTLVRIPGTPSSAAYVDDAYALMRKGRGTEALTTALFFSVCGGIFGALILMTSAPALARIAFHFTSYEFFWLTLLGLSSGAILSRGSVTKGVFSLLIGLLFSTVGLSEVYGVPRFTLGQDELMGGINFIAAMIGLFGVSEVLRNLADLHEEGKSDPVEETAIGTVAAFRNAITRLRSRGVAFLRSSSLGAVVGMLPGAGADIGAWISMGLSKRLSKNPEEYGTGSLDGIADATSTNNSALAGAWIPALVFGIPGDSITAIVIGVLLMKNVTPGPQIFADPEQSVLVHSIYITFIIANLLLIPVGILAVHSGTYLIKIPSRVLLPVILLFCILGSYAINATYFDVWVMLFMGLLGFGLEKYEIPLGPLVLALILGGQLEQTFIQNLTKSSSFADFFSRPGAAILGIFTILLWLSPILLKLRSRRA